MLLNHSFENASRSSKNNHFCSRHSTHLKHFDVVIVGAGIAGLCAALEMPQDKNVLIVEENDHLLKSASANALGMIGGHGCRNSKKPRSSFRKLLKKSLDIYPAWIKKHFDGKITLKKVAFDHILLAEENASTPRIKKLIEEEGTTFSQQKYKDFLRQYSKNLPFCEKKNENDEVITFFDTLTVDAHALMHLMEKKIKKRGIIFHYATKVKKIEKKESIFRLTLQKKDKETTDYISSCRLILASGAKTASLLSKMGFLVKSFFSWGEIIAHFPLFSQLSPPKKEENLWRWKTEKISYLFDHTHKTPTVTIAGYELRNKWDFAPLGGGLREWLQENVPFIHWDSLDFSPYQRYGMRVRARDWLPIIGWLEKDLLVISSLHKSGLTLAPLISHCVALLWDKKMNRDAIHDQFLPIVCPKRKKNGVRHATKQDFYCSYYPFD